MAGYGNSGSTVRELSMQRDPAGCSRCYYRGPVYFPEMNSSLNSLLAELNQFRRSGMARMGSSSGSLILNGGKLVPWQGSNFGN